MRLRGKLQIVMFFIAYLSMTCQEDKVDSGSGEAVVAGLRPGFTSLLLGGRGTGRTSILMQTEEVLGANLRRVDRLLRLSGHLYEPIACLSVDVGKALGRTEAFSLRP